jgi:hypothetical protein
MLAGAATVLGPAQCALLGGHSGEGKQAALGFSITGTALPNTLLRKAGLRHVLLSFVPERLIYPVSCTTIHTIHYSRCDL